MDDPQLRHRTLSVAALYEQHPYPPVGLFSGLFQRVRRDERQTLNYQALYGATWGSGHGLAPRPRILVAGCGTFEPVVVALANPGAEIVAVDLSARSLELLKRQLRLRGCGSRVLCLEADILDLPASLGSFDLIIATGVIHHLPDPAAGLRALMARATERAVFRFMIYSAWGRSLLYAAKELAAELGVSTPAGFRRMIESLPAAHPYKIYFHLYSDSATDAGLADGFLHPCDQPFTARGLRGLLSAAGLEAAFFLHGAVGNGAFGAACNGAFGAACNGPFGAPDWEKLAVLEALGELEENFRFVARRPGLPPLPRAAAWEWNEALPRRGRLPSRLLGKEVSFDRAMPPLLLSEERRQELVRGLFLAPRTEETP